MNAQKLKELREKARDGHGPSIRKMLDETHELGQKAENLSKQSEATQAKLDEKQSKLDQAGVEKAELEHQLSRLETNLASLQKKKGKEEKRVQSAIDKRRDSEVADALDKQLLKKREALTALEDEVKKLRERVQLLREGNSEPHQQVEEQRS